MALDEPKEEDSITEVDGFTFCIEKDLLESIGGATIDISYMGFSIEPDKQLPMPEGSSCSTCGTGSCS